MEHYDILSLITQDVDCQSIVNLITSNKKLYNVDTIIGLLKNNLYHRTGLVLKNATLEDLILLCLGIDKIKIYGFGDFLLFRAVSGTIYQINKNYQIKKIQLKDDIRQIEPGFDQILFLSKAGNVYYINQDNEITFRSVLNKEQIDVPHQFNRIKEANYIGGHDGILYFIKNGLLYEYEIDYLNLNRTYNPKLLSKISTFTKIFVDPEYDTTYLLDTEGNVYFIGEDGYDVWGFDGGINIPIPLNIANVVDIALGREHGLMLTVDGEVYGFGSNIFGQLGLGEIKSTKYRLLFKNIKAISAEQLTSYFLTNDANVYRCGYITKNKDFYQPNLIEELSDIVQIASSEIGTLCLDKYGDIFIVNGEEIKGLDINVYEL